MYSVRVSLDIMITLPHLYTPTALAHPLPLLGLLHHLVLHPPALGNTNPPRKLNTSWLADDQNFCQSWCTTADTNPLLLPHLRLAVALLKPAEAPRNDGLGLSTKRAAAHPLATDQAPRGEVHLVPAETLQKHNAKREKNFSSCARERGTYFIPDFSINTFFINLSLMFFFVYTLLLERA
jgi:hypothetical protein